MKEAVNRRFFRAPLQVFAEGLFIFLLPPRAEKTNLFFRRNIP